jgi:hypothetical protein
MIQLNRKRNFNKMVSVQNLIFEQKLNYKENMDYQSKLVNKLYDIQNWHYFYLDSLSFDQKVKYLNKYLGTYSIKKMLKDKGTTYLWFLEIKGQKFTVYQCSYALFMEVELKSNYKDVLNNINEFMSILFSGCTQKP